MGSFSETYIDPYIITLRQVPAMKRNVKEDITSMDLMIKR